MRLLLNVFACGAFFCLLSINTQANPRLFSDDGVLELTMETDMMSLLNDRGEEVHDHNAIFKCENEAPISVLIKARGVFRKRPENCDLPPLKVDFGKGAPEYSSFFGVGELKMVTNCKGDEYVLKEYLVYKVYEALSDQSFKVRLARITYRDIKGVVPTTTSFGFFIEDVDELVERLGGSKEIEEKLKPEILNREPLTLLYLFQFMIANEDWDFASRLQNVKIVAFEDSRAPLAVPYDFDYSGVVDPPYLNHDPDPDIRNRKLHKICRDNEEIEAALKVFEDKRDAIYRVYNDFPYLKRKPIKDALEFIDEFYKAIDNPKLRAEKFVGSCN